MVWYVFVCCVCDVVYHKNYFMCKEYLSSRNHKVDDIELKEEMCMILMMLLLYRGWLLSVEETMFRMEVVKVEDMMMILK